MFGGFQAKCVSTEPAWEKRGEWHSRGQEFDPLRLHHGIRNRYDCGFFMCFAGLQFVESISKFKYSIFSFDINLIFLSYDFIFCVFVFKVAKAFFHFLHLKILHLKNPRTKP